MKMAKMALCAAAAVPCLALFGEPATTGRDAFLKRQAFEEMQRVSGQIDVLESNFASLAERVGRIERGGGEIASLKAEIEALKAELARLRSDMEGQRREIVSDIVKRIPKPQPQPEARPQPLPERNRGPVEEYAVQPGDTLSLIAQAFGTTVPRLRELNGLKGDILRIGQKIVVPARQGGRKQ